MSTASVSLENPGGRWLSGTCLGLQRAVETAAGVFLALDLIVVLVSVVSRFFFGLSLVWADDVARALMMGLCFFGAAGAMARSEHAGVTFFVERMEGTLRRTVDAAVALVGLAITLAFFWNSLVLTGNTFEHTVGAGVPQSIFFVPMLIAAGTMTVFALQGVTRHRARDLLVAGAIGAVVVVAWTAFTTGAEEPPNLLPLMAVAFVLALVSGMSIGFVLAFASLVYVWSGDILPGEIFAQQLARGIDNFVLLAVPFFILVGYLMESNGMSVRLIALLQRAVGRLRGGLNVVMVLSMVVFSGISGSKMADVAAVGAVLVPAARRSKQNPSDAVALLASSAIMAETIPPCINLIILGFVANVSIGGLFMAGLLPATLMASALIGMSILLGSRAPVAVVGQPMPLASLIGSGVIVFGLIAVIFGGYRSGFATATEASAFAALYALVVGVAAFRELTPAGTVKVFKDSAVRAGMVMFIVAAAQTLAYTLTLEQVPHILADKMVELTAAHGAWLFMLLSILVIVVMGAVLEGPAALIIFGPLLMPVAKQLGIDPLHYGIVLVIGMGIGLFAPPLGLGLYGACLIGNVRMEETIRPIMKYLGILFLCLILIAAFPWFSTAIPRATGY